MISKVIILLAGSLLIPAESAPSCEQINTMSTVLLNTMRNQTLTISKLRALFLRLGFHDCVGGCNGCLNFNNPDNAGLQPGVDLLTSTFYSNGFDEIVSLADFFALDTTISIRNAVEASNLQRSGTLYSPCPLPCFEMQWGRTDALDCSDDDSELPSPTMTSEEMFDFFNQEFGFSKDQTVALMGAHSIGSADALNSGYTGKWTGTQNKGLSEVFYSHMINPTLTYSNINVAQGSKPAKWEFKAKFADGSNAGFMFNTDFELFYNVTLDADAKATCDLDHLCGLTNTCTNKCPMSSTFQTAYTYSQSCPTFMTDFKSVITLMLANGYDDLETTTCGC